MCKHAQAQGQETPKAPSKYKNCFLLCGASNYTCTDLCVESLKILHDIDGPQLGQKEDVVLLVLDGYRLLSL